MQLLLSALARKGKAARMSEERGEEEEEEGEEILDEQSKLIVPHHSLSSLANGHSVDSSRTGKSNASLSVH